MIQYVGVVFEVLAFVISLFVFKKNKGSFIQWMSLYLFYTAGNELLAHYMYGVLLKSTTHLFIWYHVITTIFYTYIFGCLFNQIKYHKYVRHVIWVISSVIIFSFLFMLFFVSNYVEYKYRLQIVLYFYLCILSVFYLYKEFTNDSLDELLVRKSGFWIAAGLLLFYSTLSIVTTLHPTTAKNNIFIFGLPIHLFFASILSVILYSCLSVAMIVWKKPSPKTE
jgi:hypothetical protein